MGWHNKLKYVKVLPPVRGPSITVGKREKTLTGHINRWHKSIIALNPSLITPVQKTKTTVTSQTSPGIINLVLKFLNNCGCQVQCKECRICPHNYLFTLYMWILQLLYFKNIKTIQRHLITTPILSTYSCDKMLAAL